MNENSYAEGDVLRMPQFPYDGSTGFITAVDANGVEVKKGDICRTVESTNWLQVGALFEAIAPATFDGAGGCYYRSTELASSAVRSGTFVVETDPEVRVEYKLAVAHYRWDQSEEALARLTALRDEISNEIQELQTESSEWVAANRS